MISEKTNAYATAQFYSSNGDEEYLSIVEEDEAIAYEIERVLDDVDISKHSSRERLLEASIEIFAFKTKKIPDAVLSSAAVSMVDSLNQDLLEEYFDPEGDEVVFDEEKTVAVVLAALKTIMPNVWACEQVGSRVLSGPELLAWVEEHRPDWLK